MKFLSRLLMAVALLSFLAYGSFAFGKYILSAKLFGENAKSNSLRETSRSSTEATAITRQTGWKGKEPRVDVKILPSDRSTSSTDLPEFSEDDDSTPSRTARERVKPTPTPTPTAKPESRTFDDAAVEYSLGEERRERSRKRHHREREQEKEGEERSTRSNSEESKPSRSGEKSNSQASDIIPARRSNNAGSTRGESGNSERPRANSGERSRASRQSSESPVPRPEGSGVPSGDSAEISPVPKPE